MSSSPPTNIRIPPLNLQEDSALDIETPSPSSLPVGYVLPHVRSQDNPGRVSFSQPQPAFRRPGGIPLTRTLTGGTTGGRSVRDAEVLLSPVYERPPIPSALTGGNSDGVYATPLPILPLVVLSITMLGEFLSANVCTPFLLFMVEGFLVGDTEADVGYWTGILVSMFFLTQFLTSLLWATVADRHGQRTVLFVSLLGSALTCFAFGTSTSLPEALAIRLLQGIFAGSIGVARSSVTSITDGSNEGRAYAILGFSWGLGGVAGAIIGGTFESPVKKWPQLFANVPLFNRFPYLLPCAIAASVTFTGAILSLFLARDGGSREGAIRLTIGKEETAPDAMDPPVPGDLVIDEEPSSSDNIVKQLRREVSRRFSGIFAERATDAQAPSSPSSGQLPLSSPIAIPRRTNRVASSRTSRANGSAYGYGGVRNRIPSTTTSLRRGSVASTVRHRRGTFGEGGMTDTLGNSRTEGSNFAQRLLMANGMAVTNIADLWVAAAINDSEDVFMSDEDDRDFSDEDLDIGEMPRPSRALYRTVTSSSAASRNPLEMHRTLTADSTASHNPLEVRRTLPADFAGPRNPLEISRTLTAESAASRSAFYPGRHDSPAGRFPSATSHTSPLVPGRTIPTHQMTPPRARLAAMSPTVRDSLADGTGTPSPQLRYRGSRAFSTASSQMPSIYANTGVRAPPGLLVEPPMPLQTSGEGEDPFNDGIGTIPEGQRQSQIQGEEEQPQSLFKQLPLMIILQYGLLALHSTTHDQIFLSYLVSKYDSGGLGLNAGHFAQLIALMCLAQIAYQFYLYPNIGPPRGRFSHLAMFRLGSLLFIPAYASVTIYRIFASSTEHGNFFLMTLLAISTAIRYCGSTFSYTSVAILLNYMSPPHVVGLANGLAQSIVSLARFAGPVLGGYLWSVSVQGDPNGYPLGFFICSGVCALAILHSFVIR
ncbi:hypothetical protein JB92DRAFT_2988573 [Gautieria morchelliformis]|nr:hypothetical protein JB92DRAFT_2988573 [Gautieria morchelliformis]